MLRDAINNAVKEAMKARNERALSTLRMVNSAIKNADIEARGGGKGPLDDVSGQDRTGITSGRFRKSAENPTHLSAPPGSK